MKDITKRYTHENLTIIWKPALCIHSAKCWKGENGLKAVFDPSVKPWIKPEAASSERIIEQIKLCPSGALSYELKDETPVQNISNESIKVEVSKNGPLLVFGDCTVKNSDGTETKKEKMTAFCRCGASSNKPFCDGSHRAVDFKD